MAGLIDGRVADTSGCVQREDARLRRAGRGVGGHRSGSRGVCARDGVNIKFLCIQSSDIFQVACRQLHKGIYSQF